MIGPVATPRCASAFTPVALVVAARPFYPDVAREQEAQGDTSMDVAIGATGAVVDVSVAITAGNARLDRAAMVSAASSRFAPALCDHHAAAAIFRYVVRFHLDERSGATSVTVGEPPWRGPYSELPREKAARPAGFAF